MFTHSYERSTSSDGWTWCYREFLLHCTFVATEYQESISNLLHLACLQADSCRAVYCHSVLDFVPRLTYSSGAIGRIRPITNNQIAYRTAICWLHTCICYLYLLYETQCVACLPIAIVGVCVCVCACVSGVRVFVFVCICFVDGLKKRFEINLQFFHHLVGHKKTIQRRIVAYDHDLLFEGQRFESRPFKQFRLNMVISQAVR